MKLQKDMPSCFVNKEFKIKKQELFKRIMSNRTYNIYLFMSQSPIFSKTVSALIQLQAQLGGIHTLIWMKATSIQQREGRYIFT